MNIVGASLLFYPDSEPLPLPAVSIVPQIVDQSDYVPLAIIEELTESMNTQLLVDFSSLAIGAVFGLGGKRAVKLSFARFRFTESPFNAFECHVESAFLVLPGVE